MDDREKLNRLGEEWYRMPEQGNEDARQALLEEIFILAYRMFPNLEDVISDFYVKRWKEYNPDKGPLYGFFRYRLEKHRTAVERRDYDGKPEKEIDEVTGKERPVKIRHTSLSNPIGEDGDSLADLQRGDANVDDSGMMIDELVLELMTIMLDLKGHLDGRAGNPQKINYYRLFFTDGIVHAIRGQGAEAFVRRERDLFRVIKESFLNFFMSSPCGSVEDILAAGLNPYGQMVEGRPMEPPKQPLPNDVYTTYLRQVEHYTATAQAVSQQRTAYQTFIRDQLRC